MQMMHEKGATAGRAFRIGGALGGTRTPTMLLTATSRQRVYQFRHERLGNRDRHVLRTGSMARDVTNQRWGDKTCRACHENALLPRPDSRLPGIRASICLTSTAMRLRSTNTTPLAIGRLLAKTLTSSVSFASSSMIAPRLSRIT